MENAVLEIDSIPVIIDNFKKYRDFEMTRCSYLMVKSDLTKGPSILSPNWMLLVQNSSIPFCLIGLSGIIWKPLGDKYIFDSPDSVKELFDAIEISPLLCADVSDLWLPTHLFNSSPQERGSVYRISGKLFSKAYSYCQEQISQEEFFEFCKQSGDEVAFSEIETRAFRVWNDMQADLYEKSVFTFHSQQQTL